MNKISIHESGHAGGYSAFNGRRSVTRVQIVPYGCVWALEDSNPKGTIAAIMAGPIAVRLLCGGKNYASDLSESDEDGILEMLSQFPRGDRHIIRSQALERAENFVRSNKARIEGCAAMLVRERRVDGHRWDRAFFDGDLFSHPANFEDVETETERPTPRRKAVETEPEEEHAEPMPTNAGVIGAAARAAFCLLRGVSFKSVSAAGTIIDDFKAKPGELLAALLTAPLAAYRNRPHSDMMALLSSADRAQADEALDEVHNGQALFNSAISASEKFIGSDRTWRVIEAMASELAKASAPMNEQKFTALWNLHRLA